ncbi:DsbA family protein [Rugosimonospora acidiphila]|uniref:DsbA family protein n=1 Tax=Rugosimonospora acidiphila TaxID=556531 RepID=A0ABP9RLX5_9ACTN
MTTPLQVSPARLTVPVQEYDHVCGPDQAAVTLVEYGDYQCPYCAAAHPIINDLLRERPETLRFAFRHFPLTNVHPYSEMAAETAEAAGVRDRFWQMHAWLYEHQNQFQPAFVATAVDQVGLPGDTVAREVNEHLYLDRVQRDFAGGIRSGVNGTPSFFINGIRHDGGYTLGELIEAVDSAAGRD